MPSPTPSVKTQKEAISIAKATQRPSQTKEQTKLIAQGIEKGIDLYKKQQKARQRQRDKLQKKARKQQEIRQTTSTDNTPSAQFSPSFFKSSRFPWLLLFISWLIFIAIHIIDT